MCMPGSLDRAVAAAGAVRPPLAAAPNATLRLSPPPPRRREPHHLPLLRTPSLPQHSSSYTHLRLHGAVGAAPIRPHPRSRLRAVRFHIPDSPSVSAARRPGLPWGSNSSNSLSAFNRGPRRELPEPWPRAPAARRIVAPRQAGLGYPPSTSSSSPLSLSYMVAWLPIWIVFPVSGLVVKAGYSRTGPFARKKYSALGMTC